MRIPYLRAQAKTRRIYLQTKGQRPSLGANWGRSHCLLRLCTIPTSSRPSVRKALQARPQSPSTEWVNESNSTPRLLSRQSLVPSTNEYVQNKPRAGNPSTTKTREPYGGTHGQNEP